MDFEDLKKFARRFEASLDTNTGQWNFKTDPNNPRDVEDLARFVQTIQPTPVPTLVPTPARQENLTGTSIEETAARYQTRHQKSSQQKLFMSMATITNTLKTGLPPEESQPISH